MRRLVIGIVAIVVVLAIIAGQGGAKNATATPSRASTATTATGTPAQSNLNLSPADGAATVAANNRATQGLSPPTGATVQATSTPTVAPQVVSVIDNAVNVREAASMVASAFATLDNGTDLSVLGPDTTGPDGTTRWVHVAANGRDGYVRSDLVSAPRAYVAATAIPPTSVPPTSVLTSAESTATKQAGIYAKYPIIDAADLAKRPDFYKGKTFRITGRIANVAEKNGITAFTMFAETVGGSTVPIAVGFQGSDTHIQEDVRLSAYCTGIGTLSGTNGFGAKITQAACTADILSPP